ncbi:unnamed protein product [Bursaphelenchus xylophilus]|uniref:(pine wood nematode) hypothetical protein n=1 Tax=Bursaphelenchus xylophilus TaxID=6326 RepID=A0A1I7S110_BURXY|nr:unnamed protein product [Bursaphelenchus xylophilus]CAG9087989.1 unnamed protein product [Bursaphelenchus xylophilus]
MAAEAYRFQLTRVCWNSLCIILLFSMNNIVFPCKVEDCTGRYSQLMHDKVLNPTESPEYCAVLFEYIQCLTTIQTECRSFLHFHSSFTAANQRWKRFRCEKETLPALETSREQQTCSAMPREDQRTCAFFGRAHLRRTDGAMETCAEIGTRPLIDNKFLVVQVTTRPETYSQYPLVVVSKVSIILRSNSLCEETRIYQADAEDPRLPNAFTDGTTYAGDDNDPPLSLAKRNESTIRIFVNYLATEIVIHKIENCRLAVVVNTPEKVLHLEYDDSPLRQLCLTGCPLAVHNVREAIEETNTFTKCQGLRRTKYEKPEAYDVCRQDHVRGDLHSSCAFDLMFGTTLSSKNRTEAAEQIVDEWHTVVRTLRYFDALKSTRSRAAIASVRRLERTRVKCAFSAANTLGRSGSIFISLFVFVICLMKDIL